MNFLKSVSCDFRKFLYVNREVYKRAIVPAILWKALEKTDIVLWGLILKKFRVNFIVSETEDPAHTVLGEFHGDKDKVFVHAMVSKTDTHHNLIFQVIQTVMHEYIHASQIYCNEDTFLDFQESNNFIEYISEWREIQALSHCAFLEIMEYTDRPTLTTGYYLDAPDRVKKRFWKFVVRWSNKYQVNLQLKK